MESIVDSRDNFARKNLIVCGIMTPSIHEMFDEMFINPVINQPALTNHFDGLVTPLGRMTPWQSRQKISETLSKLKRSMVHKAWQLHKVNKTTKVGPPELGGISKPKNNDLVAGTRGLRADELTSEDDCVDCTHFSPTFSTGLNSVCACLM